METDSEKDLFEQLQAEIIADAKKIYSEEVIARWLSPRNLGKIENPQGFGRTTGLCGDTMGISLKIKNDKIIEAKFLTEGYGPTLAAGSMATELVTGKTVPEAFKVSQQIILDNLGGLPPEESQHCVLLASDTLKEAFRNYLAFKKEPWKRAYNKL